MDLYFSRARVNRFLWVWGRSPECWNHRILTRNFIASICEAQSAYGDLCLLHTKSPSRDCTWRTHVNSGRTYSTSRFKKPQHYKVMINQVKDMFYVCAVSEETLLRPIFTTSTNTSDIHSISGLCKGVITKPRTPKLISRYMKEYRASETFGRRERSSLCIPETPDTWTTMELNNGRGYFPLNSKDF